MEPASDRGGPALRVEDVSVHYGGNSALESVSCSVQHGEIFGLIGPNGAGKSTLLKAVSGIQDVVAGRIRLGDEDVTRKGFAARCRMGLGLTFQIPRNSSDLTVFEELVGQSGSIRHVRGRRSHPWLESTWETLVSLDLGDVADRPIGKLTLGEIRRFELARAVVNRPRVLLVDEPSSGMSSEEAVLLADALRRIADSGVAVLLVEHNIPFIAALTARAMVLDAGRVLVEGRTEDVLASDAVKEAYLGKSTT